MYLALDSATPAGVVAVGDRNGLIAEATASVVGRHAESLLGAVDRVLESAGIEPGQITGVVVGSGPGSFTGIRVAAATAKGLVHALRVPLYAYSGLLALAASLGAERRPVCALLDARRDQVYAACYRFPGFRRLETVMAPVSSRIDDVLETLESVRALGAIYVGDGAILHAERIRTAGGEVAPAHLATPRAGALLWLARTDPDGGLVADPATWEPEYLREWGGAGR